MLWRMAFSVSGRRQAEITQAAWKGLESEVRIGN